MATMRAAYVTGEAQCVAIFRNTAGQALIISTGLFENYNQANVANYQVACTEQGTSGLYQVTVPSNTVHPIDLEVTFRDLGHNLIFGTGTISLDASGNEVSGVADNSVILADIAAMQADITAMQTTIDAMQTTIDALAAQNDALVLDLQTIQDIAEADRVATVVGGNFEEHWLKRGTSEILLVKRFLLLNGTPVTDITDTIGQVKE